MEQFDRFVQKWIREHQPEIVFGMDRNRTQTHLRAGNGVHAAYLQSRLFAEGKRKTFLCRFNPLHRKILELEKEGFENPSLQKLFTNSHMVSSEILNTYNVQQEKVKVVHNGVEWVEMEPAFALWEERKNQPFQFLFIGHGYLRKGLERLLTGLSLLKTQEFHLTVIGRDKNMALFREQARRLKLQERITFIGPTTDVIPYYQQSDCLVIPSFYDPFANVTVEALAMGLFVVSSRHNGGSEVLTSETGVVIEDLLNDDSVKTALEQAMKCPKTRQSAIHIRQSVKHLDFANQLTRLMEHCV